MAEPGEAAKPQEPLSPTPGTPTSAEVAPAPASGAAPAPVVGGAPEPAGESGASAAPPGLPVDESAKPFALPAFGAARPDNPGGGIDLLGDVNLQVEIELGRTKMLVEDVLRLSEGAVVELDKLAGDPVDVYVNGRPVARGEVLVLNDNFCVRVSEILNGVVTETA